MFLVILSVKILSGCIHSNSEVLLYVIMFCCFVVYFPSFLHFSRCDTTKGGYQNLAMSGDKTDPKSYSNKFHNSEIPKISGCSKLMQLWIVINIGKKESPFRSTWKINCLTVWSPPVLPFKQTSPREVPNFPTVWNRGVQGLRLGQRSGPSLPEPNRPGRCARSATRGDGTYALAVGEPPGVFMGTFQATKRGGLRGWVLRYHEMYREYRCWGCRLQNAKLLKSKSTIINHLVEEFSVPLIWRHHHVVSKVGLVLFPPVWSRFPCEVFWNEDPGEFH